jgi:hypothetical protein
MPARSNKADLIHEFMNGGCYAFAMALHQATGLPIHGLYADDPESPHHAFVVDPTSGAYYDARGPHGSVAMLRSYRGRQAAGWDVRPIAHDLLRSLMRETGCGEAHVKKARKLMSMGSPLYDLVWAFDQAKKDEKDLLPIPATDETVALARDFVMRMWQERAAERGLEIPMDLSRSCKFSSLFAATVFGGTRKGNDNHEFLVLSDRRIIDLNADAEDVRSIPDPYRHDPVFWNNPDHRDSIASCKGRVSQWITRFVRDHHHRLKTLRTITDEAPAMSP